MKRMLALLLTVTVLMALAPATSLAADTTFTLMVYMCGTDLESDGGLATADLNEMIASKIPAHGNLIVYVQTGGTRTWSNSVMTNKIGERWTLDKDGLTQVDSLGKVDMGKGETFQQFLQYGFENFAADRYGLILWDHGAGATDGVCYDEISGDSLNMAEIYSALNNAAREPAFHKFSFVGFDACLMANYEMAVHLEPYADYMIASEETEPGDGWNYKSWLPLLVKNSDADIATVGAKIVDSFVQSVDSSYGDFGTLSVADLSKLDALRAAVETMGESLKGEIDGGNFSSISRLRQNVRSFGETSDAASDMIDLGVFASLYERYSSTGAAALRAALDDVVVYSKHTSNLTDITGLAVLVPYSTRDTASTYLAAYDTQNLMPNYTAFVKSMLDNMGAGSYSFSQTSVTQQSVQDATVDWFSQYSTDTQSYYDAYQGLWSGMTSDTSTQEPSGSTGDTGTSEFSLDNFLNTLFGDSTETFNASATDVYDLWGDTSSTSGSTVNSATFGDLWGTQTDTQPATVDITSGDQTYTVDNPFANAQGDSAYSVTLSEEDMQYLASADACLMMDISEEDFPCYLDLGYTQDVIVDWNQGKLYGLFDGTWPTLDGQMVCIYDQVANESFIRSLIPVLLNGNETYLLVVFDETNPGGIVVGETEGYTESGQPARGYEKLKEGDIVIPQYDLLYWDENDELCTEPYEGDPITVGADGYIAFGYDDVLPDFDYAYGFCLNDVFGDYQYTDFITLSY